MRKLIMGLALAGLVAVPAAAQNNEGPCGGFKHDRNTPVEITANALEVRQAAQIAIFTGKVVAAAVGAMMTVLMGVRDADALARACDLGVAMQLTNISRDVGEDARMGRIYLPLDWLREVGLEPKTFLADPIPDERIRGLTKRLLKEANRLYIRGEAGISALPLSSRPGIYAARHVYAGIGGAIAKNGYDTISYRAHTYKSQKIGWLMLSAARTVVTAALPQSAVLHARPLEETAFLVNAAARAKPVAPNWGEGRAGALLSVLAELEARDQQIQLERHGA